MFDFCKYIFNPTYLHTTDNQSITKKMIFGFKLFVLLFILLFILEIGLRIGIGHFVDMPKRTRNLDDYSAPVLLLVGGVLFPFLEELAFRGLLVFNRWIFISFGVLSYLIVRIFISTDENELLREAISAGIALIFTVLFYFIISKYYTQLSQFWQRNFKYIFYISAFGFGLLHYSNYTLELKQLLLIPLLTLSQVIGGLFYGYIRMRFGIAYSIFFHTLNNVIVLALMLLTR